jgi:hypothetical protein
MLIDCTNKGCMQKSEAKYNTETDEVICEECGQPISNITLYTKRMLASLKQVINTKRYKPFQVNCPTCKAQREITLVGNVPHCVACNLELKLAPAFLIAYKNHISKQED